MRRPAVFAIAAMLVGTIFVAAAPLALANDGRDRGGDHGRCDGHGACPSANTKTRPGWGFGDKNHEHTGPAGNASFDCHDRDVNDNDESKHDEDNDTDRENGHDEDEGMPCTTATVSPSPTASPSETETTSPSPSMTASASPTASPSPSATASATASPTASTGTTNGRVDIGALQLLITLIRDLLATVQTQLASL